MKKTLVVTVVMLSLTATMPFLWHMNMAKVEDESEKKLGRIVRSLNSVQQERENIQKNRDLRMLSIVNEQFPWLIQNNTLPNYFLRGETGDNDKVYQDGAVVFLHNHRSAGTAVRQCLDQIGQDNMYAMSPVMGSDQRQDWDSGNLINEDLRDRLKIHRGQFAFGMCNNLERKCSNFVILRDPMERSISSYYYCREAIGDELCKVLNANGVTLREWILHHGSLSFQQLLFQSQWCPLVAATNNTSSQPSRGQLIEWEKMPCWYKHKLALKKLSPQDMKHILDYVLENLEKWFAVLGLFEELDASINMIEHVYKLPVKSCHTLKVHSTKSDIFDNRANRKKRRGGYYDDNDPEYLKYDYEVRSALDADNKIYRKAKKLFQLQKQILYNTVNR